MLLNGVTLTEIVGHKVFCLCTCLTARSQYRNRRSAGAALATGAPTAKVCTPTKYVCMPVSQVCVESKLTYCPAGTCAVRSSADTERRMRNRSLNRVESVTKN